MSERVQMPALGESVTEGTVTRWLKSVGDEVAVDEPLLEVSTDKVDTEIPSPVAGVLQEILVEEDDTVPVGADLAVVGDGEPSSGDSDGEGSSSQDQGGSDAGPDDEVEDPADTGAVAEAGDEGGQEPAEPQAESSGEPESPDEPEQPSSGGSGGEGTTVTMPALGESVTEGTITRWLKAEGDEVAVDEPLLEVSTDKVDTEIPSPAAGTVTAILVQEDETVPVGADLAVVGGSGGGSQATEEAPAEASPEREEEPEAAPEEPAEPEPQEPASDTQEEPAPAQEAPPQEKADEAAAAADEAPSGATGGSSAPTPRESDTDASAYVTPLVRKLAADHHIDLSTIEGSGIGGRIRKQDVLAAAEAKKAPQPQAPAPSAQASAPSAPAGPTKAPVDTSLRGTTQPMSRLRKTIARRMVESLQVSAQLTTVVEVDVTRIARLRDAAKGDFAAREGTKLSFLPFFALAAVEALKAHPTVNASIEEDQVTYHGAEHLGIAVDTDKGLIVPVIRNAGDLNIAGLARGIADLAERTRSNKIAPDDLAGGTFTITNTGSRGALFDTPIINQPQVGILGTGAVVRRPVVVRSEDGGETIAIRSMVYLALSYDHRIVDGADAARFLSTMKQRLEEGAFEADLGL
ncbi:2-oxoglutarate dehydrogenase, E2 component, dihydrolipoamide succinyltransferase [Phycicoccus endophyticus]|uniref:Dihydrolipoamide acetyltransferase component of pyruvate dehydrogenase complex n=1 Tax=Phycicoccus endophyticus TaxID=1690220 RepID=A0A7G9R515_9MICO|nr:2-oxoglutarate dehydrogenase, E2 component, dihydrolipoamide succinyltransferase [Phycicoccus endophyticus]NHI20918.1 2-oxoglutarate dehydrogenase, E2 component, dihydrolipoamide succinyltransferase [Phycicoccus endophyticus]QNN50690.1 2-oxoglutarate dehydrogenase, E2 component, dihydrolipoamide succinyltransferase [Phycicoccus endophyticus]GGL22263.1 dihydrolipoamide acetyltransferase component of pyruvate dehydrogenase complex [Phycicoccus endophyticus]